MNWYHKQSYSTGEMSYIPVYFLDKASHLCFNYTYIRKRTYNHSPNTTEPKHIADLCIDKFVFGFWLYRMSREKCVRLRESVPYVKVYRYNPKHLYPKLNVYGDNGQRKVTASCGSKYCNLHSWRVTWPAHVLETGMQYSYVVGLYQNAQSAKLNQYFHTAGYSCAM
jgi:hypothetical protein